MIDPPKALMNNDIEGKIQKAIIDSSYYSYDRFKKHICDLLEDCNFISCSFGKHAESMSWKSDYELDSISPYDDDRYYKWEPRIEELDNGMYDFENEYYTTTGYSDFLSSIKRIPLNTCRLLKKGSGEYMDIVFICEDMYRVGKIYFDNLESLDTHILKWVLS